VGSKRLDEKRTLGSEWMGEERKEGWMEGKKGGA